MRTVLAASAKRSFRSEESGLSVRYFGRAGTVEGLGWARSWGIRAG